MTLPRVFSFFWGCNISEATVHHCFPGYGLRRMQVFVQFAYAPRPDFLNPDICFRVFIGQNVRKPTFFFFQGNFTWHVPAINLIAVVTNGFSEHRWIKIQLGVATLVYVPENSMKIISFCSSYSLKIIHGIGCLCFVPFCCESQLVTGGSLTDFWTLVQVVFSKFVFGKVFLIIALYRCEWELGSFWKFHNFPKLNFVAFL